MGQIGIHVNKKSLRYLAVYGAVIFIVLVAILFLYFKVTGQTQENDKLSSQIKTQQELKPVYAALNAMRNQEHLVLPNPDKTAISRSEAGKFQDEFRTIAGKSGLTVVSLIPDLNTSASPSVSFLHNITLKGDSSGFRKMLKGLGAVSYLDRIEEVDIQQKSDSMEFKMKVWIAVK